MPSVGDTGWATPVNANCALLDALSPVGGLAVTTKEQPSASLNVSVAPGTFVDQGGTPQTYGGAPTYPITASSTKVLYLDGTNGWALTSAASFPTTPHVRLATVVAGAGTITSITDNRNCLNIAGAQNPVVTHLLSTATATPTIAAGPAAGAGPTVSVGSNSTDVAGSVTITTGTSPSTGTLATVTFNLGFGAQPRAFSLEPANAAAAGLAGLYSNIANLTPSSFTIDAATAPAASTSYKFWYLVVG